MHMYTVYIDLNLYIYIYWIPVFYAHVQDTSRYHMSGSQADLLLAMDMAKVGGPLLVVKVHPI